MKTKAKRYFYSARGTDPYGRTQRTSAVILSRWNLSEDKLRDRIKRIHINGDGWRDCVLVAFNRI